MYMPSNQRLHFIVQAGDAGSFLKRTSDYLWKKQVSQERVQQEIEAEASLKVCALLLSFVFRPSGAAAKHEITPE
jgi:hypothetical protein